MPQERRKPSATKGQPMIATSYAPYATNGKIGAAIIPACTVCGDCTYRVDDVRRACMSCDAVSFIHVDLDAETWTITRTEKN